MLLQPSNAKYSTMRFAYVCYLVQVWPPCLASDTGPVEFAVNVAPREWLNGKVAALSANLRLAICSLLLCCYVDMLGLCLRELPEPKHIAFAFKTGLTVVCTGVMQQQPCRTVAAGSTISSHHTAG
jgi:hypothetical protein